MFTSAKLACVACPSSKGGSKPLIAIANTEKPAVGSRFREPYGKRTTCKALAGNTSSQVKYGLQPEGIFPRFGARVSKEYRQQRQQPEYHDTGKPIQGRCASGCLRSSHPPLSNHLNTRVLHFVIISISDSRSRSSNQPYRVREVAGYL